QRDSSPASSAARAARTAPSGSAQGPTLMPKRPSFIALLYPNESSRRQRAGSGAAAARHAPGRELVSPPAVAGSPVLHVGREVEDLVARDHVVVRSRTHQDPRRSP